MSLQGGHSGHIFLPEENIERINFFQWRALHPLKFRASLTYQTSLGFLLNEKYTI